MKGKATVAHRNYCSISTGTSICEGVHEFKKTKQTHTHKYTHGKANNYSDISNSTSEKM
jgi:hypothetical protein